MVTAALSWVLSKNTEGGDLFCFFCCDFTKVPRSAFPGLQVGLVRKEKHFPTPSEEREGRSVWGEIGARTSVGETLAGLLPAAGCAPHVAILHAVHLPALLALSPGLPVRQARKRRSVRVILWAFFADLKIPGKL